MGTTDTVDWMAVLRGLVLDDQEIRGLVDNRVYVDQIPRGAKMPAKAVLLVQTGGESRIRLPIVYVDLQVRCYGETIREARAVYRVLRKLLHFMRYQSKQVEGEIGLVLRAWEVGGPSDETEPETGWPFTVATFRCMIISFPVGG